MRRWLEKSSSNPLHLPVMVEKVVEVVTDCPDGVFVDATVGAGGHLRAVFKAHGNRFQYLGFDIDARILVQTKGLLSRQGIKAELINTNFKKIVWHLQRRGITKISAVLFDLGIGSFQIDDPSRGFSYLQDGPLSMSFDGSDSLAASKMLAGLGEKDLIKLLKDYGEEPKAIAIARAIKNNVGIIETTGQLAQIIRSVAGDRRFVRTAARVFQALRIKVNEEFENITKGLDKLLPIIAPGGRALVITYHSLEDHLVKRIFKKFSGKCICPPKVPECRCGKVNFFRPVFDKPLIPEDKEVALNPRARSAKLRVVERIAFAA